MAKKPKSNDEAVLMGGVRIPVRSERAIGRVWTRVDHEAVLREYNEISRGMSFPHSRYEVAWCRVAVACIFVQPSMTWWGEVNAAMAATIHLKVKGLPDEIVKCEGEDVHKGISIGALQYLRLCKVIEYDEKTDRVNIASQPPDEYPKWYPVHDLLAAARELLSLNREWRVKMDALLKGDK